MATCFSDLQMAAALRKAGVNAGNAAFLVATAHPESGGCAVEQQGQPYNLTGWGVWQITPGNSEPQFGTNNALFGLQANANAAAAKLQAQGLGAWTTINDGAFRPYFKNAKSAVSKVYGMSMSQVDSLVATAGTVGATGKVTHGSGGGGLFGSLGGDLINAFLGATGLPSLNNIFIRLGLIVLGGLLLLAGVYMLAKGAENATIHVALKDIMGESSGSGESSDSGRRQKTESKALETATTEA